MYSLHLNLCKKFGLDRVALSFRALFMTLSLRFLKQHLIIFAIVRIAELSLLFGQNSALIWSRLPAGEDLRVEFFNFGEEEEVQWSNFCKLHKAKIHFQSNSLDFLLCFCWGTMTSHNMATVILSFICKPHQKLPMS